MRVIQQHFKPLLPMLIPIWLLIVIAVLIFIVICAINSTNADGKKELLKQCHVKVSLHPDSTSDMLLVSWTQPWNHKFEYAEHFVFISTLEACGYGTDSFKKENLDNVLRLHKITNVIVRPVPVLTIKENESSKT